MRQPTLQGIAAEVKLPARWVLPDLESCTADQLVGMAYTAAMDPVRYETLVSSPQHVQALLGLILRFDSMLSAALGARSTQEALITALSRSLRNHREALRCLIQQAERRVMTCWCSDTDRDHVPPAVDNFDEKEIRDAADE